METTVWRRGVKSNTIKTHRILGVFITRVFISCCEDMQERRGRSVILQMVTGVDSWAYSQSIMEYSEFSLRYAIQNHCYEMEWLGNSVDS